MRAGRQPKAAGAPQIFPTAFPPPETHNAPQFDNIAYGVNDPLPARLALGLALQQIAFLGALMVIPDIYARASGLPEPDGFLNLASATLLVSALVIVLQVRAIGYLGAGYYYPLQATGAVLPGMYLVAQLPGAGLEAVFGMVWVVGLTQIGFSFLILRMRNIFTAEVLAWRHHRPGPGHAGAACSSRMLGPATITAPALRGPAAGGRCWRSPPWWAATSGRAGCSSCWRRSPAAMGMGFSLAFGLMPEQMQAWHALAWLRLPQLSALGWRFEAAAIVPHAVTGFALAVTPGHANHRAAQRRRRLGAPPPAPLARGVRAEGVAHLFAALVNGLPMAASGVAEPGGGLGQREPLPGVLDRGPAAAGRTRAQAHRRLAAAAAPGDGGAARVPRHLHNA